MEMPFNMVCDEYTKARLKQEHKPCELHKNQVSVYKHEIDKKYAQLDSVKQLKLAIYIDELYSANARTWGAESKIREAVNNNVDINTFEPYDNFESAAVDLFKLFFKIEPKDNVTAKLQEFLKQNWHYFSKGRRLVVCRESNKLRLMFRNNISELIEEPEFKEIKVDHASEIEVKEDVGTP